MSPLAMVVGVILPPVTFVLFAGALLNRIWVWRRPPEADAARCAASSRARAAAIMKETLLVPSLFLGDRFLWALSWVFHLMLVLIFLGHVRVVADVPQLWEVLHLDPYTMSGVVGGAAGATIVVMIVLLIARRVAAERVQEVSAPADYFALFLLMAIVLTGNAMRFLGPVDLAETHRYFASFATLQLPVVPANNWFLAHLFLGQMLLLYMPFSKIMHFGGVFFTQAAIKRS